MLPDEIYGGKRDWLGKSVCEATDLFYERRRVLEGRVKLLLLRKLVERGRAAPVEELRITRIFDTRSMPDDVFSKVLAFWHPPGSLPPRLFCDLWHPPPF